MTPRGTRRLSDKLVAYKEARVIRYPEVPDGQQQASGKANWDEIRRCLLDNQRGVDNNVSQPESKSLAEQRHSTAEYSHWGLWGKEPSTLTRPEKRAPTVLRSQTNEDSSCAVATDPETETGSLDVPKTRGGRLLGVCCGMKIRRLPAHRAKRLAYVQRVNKTISVRTRSNEKAGRSLDRGNSEIPRPP